MRIWGRLQLLYSRFEATLHYKRPCPNIKQKHPQIYKMMESKRLCRIISNTQNSPNCDSPVDAAVLTGSLSLPDSLCHLEHFLLSLPNAHTTAGCTTQHLLESGVEILLTVPRDQRQTSPWIVDWVDHAQKARAGSRYRELWCKLASRT